MKKTFEENNVASLNGQFPPYSEENTIQDYNDLATLYPLYARNRALAPEDKIAGEHLHKSNEQKG